jgi:hypothetical protein
MQGCTRRGHALFMGFTEAHNWSGGPGWDKNHGTSQGVPPWFLSHPPPLNGLRVRFRASQAHGPAGPVRIPVFQAGWTEFERRPHLRQAREALHSRTGNEGGRGGTSDPPPHRYMRKALHSRTSNEGGRMGDPPLPPREPRPLWTPLTGTGTHREKVIGGFLIAAKAASRKRPWGIWGPPIAFFLTGPP